MAFDDTRWSLVLRAGLQDESSRAALEELCRQYWPPLYSFLRAKGYDADSAADVLQGFFEQLLERRVISKADPQRGRFRTYLLTVLTRYASNERSKAHALKRGGKVAFVRIDDDSTWDFHQRLAQSGASPEEIYERQWAMSVVNQAVDRLRQEYEDAGKSDLFNALRSTLIDDGQAGPYAAVAEQLGMKEGAVRVAVHRMRTRFRQALTDVVAETVDSEDKIEPEIRDLIDILGRKPNTSL